jgi:SSS family solute:Na+ symporter
VFGVLVTSIGWVTVTLLTPPADAETLRSFHKLIRPMGSGWKGAGLELDADDDDGSITAALLAWFLGCTVVYGAIFGTGYLLYGETMLAIVCLAVASVSGALLLRTLPRLGLQ